jgi:AraC-like DNA-binding protein
LPGPIPLIRAGAMAPFLRWMRAKGAPVDALLRDADLACFAMDDPDQPIPLLALFRFACMASRIEGPDLPARVVIPSSLSELGIIGSVALGRSTIRAALTAVMTTLPYHTTHEIISVRPVPGGAVLREAWGMRLDDETRHVAQQYVAALIQLLCDPGGTGRPVFSRMSIVAHPVHGIAHLQPYFGQGLVAARDGVLELHIADHVIDRPGRPVGHGQTRSRPLPDTPLPHGKDGLIPSARLVVAGLLSRGTPTIQHLATAAGQSVRTFQRRLAQEGTTFSHLVEDVRRERAMAALAAGQASAGEIAACLGYQRQSSLTRAVRRWSGTTPRQMRPRNSQRREIP